MRTGRLGLLWAVLLAFSWQTFVTQTHQHFDAGPVFAAAPAKADGAGPQRPARQSPSDLPANCPICRGIAHAGQILLPPPIHVEAPAPLIFRPVLTTLVTLARTRRSHTWQSRAPPR
jgi:hypothetical protein